MIRKRMLLVIAAVAALAAAGTALATLGSGTTASTFVRATLDGNKKHERVKAHADHIKLDAKGPTDVAVQTITFAAGGSSGWHSHPGIVLVAVQSGTLTRYNAECETTQYGPREGFVEFGDHAGLVRNNTATNTVVYVTYIVPKATTSLRNDQPQPATCSAS